MRNSTREYILEKSNLKQKAAARFDRFRARDDARDETARARKAKAKARIRAHAARSNQARPRVVVVKHIHTQAKPQNTNRVQKPNPDLAKSGKKVVSAKPGVPKAPTKKV